MATIGVDCHFTLRHDAVNGGQAVGFIAAADRRGPLIAVTYRRDDTWVWADAGTDASSAALEVTALGLGQGLLAPGGAAYGLTSAQVRNFLLAFWNAVGPITYADAWGTLVVTWMADGLAERRYPDGSEMTLRFTVIG
ncbi:MAG: hypothetical protein U0641_12535 [Anaerolineae bacterium]